MVFLLTQPFHPHHSQFCLVSTVSLYVSGVFYVITMISNTMSRWTLSAALEERHSVTEITFYYLLCNEIQENIV